MQVVTSAVLHIGAGKCGSSAIQTAFSRQPFLGSDRNGGVQYVVVGPDGSLRAGDAMANSVEGTVEGYFSSVSAKDLAALPSATLDRLARQMANVAGEGGRLVLSHEGWLNEYPVFQKSRLLHKLGLDCEVVVYVRPPVEWLNSAWWQWGAWSGVPFNRWFRHHLERVCWHDRLAHWFGMEHVGRVTLRVLPNDVVSDFCSVLNIPPIQSNRNNTSLPGSVLRLFQRHRELRPGPHDSAIDFVLSRHFGELGDSPPWVLGQKRVAQIMEETRESNLRLLDCLDEVSRIAMRDDPRWWDAKAFADRKRKPAMTQAPDPDALDQLAARALKVIWELDDENRQLRKSLVKATKSRWSIW